MLSFTEALVCNSRRASLQVVNIGNINDPEKTKADKEKKATVNHCSLSHILSGRLSMLRRKGV